jgi:hypothetical protein
MIPAAVRDVANGPVWITLASRDAQLRPSTDYAFGVLLEDEQHVTILVPDVRAQEIRARLAVSPRLAVSMNSYAEVRCYQLKGEVVATRQGDLRADGLLDIHAARLATKRPHMASVLAAFRRRPCTAFTVRVDACFDQTPGPGAGRRVGEAPTPQEPAVRGEGEGIPSERATLPAELKGVLEATSVASVSTCSKSGEPNATVISEVWWVDASHIALSFQFFNKTIRNIRENPFAGVKIFDPKHLTTWNLSLGFLRSETSGPTFEEMEARLEAIASMEGMTGVFRLRAADVYGVLGVRRNEDEFQ